MGTIKNVLSEGGVGDSSEIAAGCHMVGMVENRLEYCSYPKGQGVSSSSGIIRSAWGQQCAVKGPDVPWVEIGKQGFAQEYPSWSLPTAVLIVQGETICLKCVTIEIFIQQ